MAAKVEAGFYVIYNIIPEVMASVEAASRYGVKAQADKILTGAKRRINRLTGDLQDTAYTQSVEAGKTAEIIFPSDHAAPVEYGTWKMAAEPYLSPEMEAQKNSFFTEIFKDAFHA